MGCMTDSVKAFSGPPPPDREPIRGTVQAGPVGSMGGPLPTQLVVDASVVHDYTQKLVCGQNVDPIEVVRLPDGREFITEGHHRYIASQRAGIPVGQRTFDTGGPVGFDWSK